MFVVAIFLNIRICFLILVCNFIGWIKVSTDIFCVFALFLAVHLVMETTNVDKIGLSQKYLIDD